jgi:hypothetical protein
MHSRMAASRWLATNDSVEVLMADIAPENAVRGNARFLGEDAGGKLIGRYLERKEGDDRPVLGDTAAIGGARRFRRVGPMLGAGAVFPIYAVRLESAGRTGAARRASRRDR